jgi:hypothetical protein
VDGEILARLGTSSAAATIEEIDLSRCLALTDADLLQLRWFPRLRCVALRSSDFRTAPTPTCDRAGSCAPGAITSLQPAVDPSWPKLALSSRRVRTSFPLAI